MASTWCLSAASLCPISCEPKIAMMAAAKVTIPTTSCDWKYPAISMVPSVAKNNTIFMMGRLGFMGGFCVT